MQSALGKRVISNFPVGSEKGGKWDQLRGWGKGWGGDGVELGQEMGSLMEMEKALFSLSPSGNRSPRCTAGRDGYLSCAGEVMIGGRNERGAVCYQSK